jgi:hypothetical protein
MAIFVSQKAWANKSETLAGTKTFGLMVYYDPCMQYKVKSVFTAGWHRYFIEHWVYTCPLFGLPEKMELYGMITREQRIEAEKLLDSHPITPRKTSNNSKQSMENGSAPENAMIMLFNHFGFEWVTKPRLGLNIRGDIYEWDLAVKATPDNGPQIELFIESKAQFVAGSMTVKMMDNIASIESIGTQWFSNYKESIKVPSHVTDSNKKYVIGSGDNKLRR